MAPELLLADGADPDAGKPSQSSDMYAFAMVIWEVRTVYNCQLDKRSNRSQIFTGRIPFDHIPSEYKILMDVSIGARPLRPEDAEEIGFSDSLWAVMLRCWLPESEQRPSCREVTEALTSLDGPTSLAAIGHEILDGIYEIIDMKVNRISSCALATPSPSAYFG